MAVPTPRCSVGDAFQVGVYELVFFAGAYLRTYQSLPDPAFLDEIIVRFGVADAERARSRAAPLVPLRLQHLPGQLMPELVVRGGLLGHSSQGWCRADLAAEGGMIVGLGSKSARAGPKLTPKGYTSFRVLLTPTFTLTNPAGRTGKASPQAARRSQRGAGRSFLRCP